MKFLGLIKITSGRVTVSDPCYEPGIWCASEIKVMPGAYLCLAEEKNRYISSIQIRHSRHTEVAPKELNSVVNVDSGQCGFYEKEYYDANQGGEATDTDTMYGKVCELSLSDEQAGILDGKCFVSQSGDGDGMYKVYVGTCKVWEQEDVVVSVKIQFL